MTIDPSQRLAGLFDAVFTRRRTKFFEQAILALAVAGFLIHLSLILVAGLLGPAAGILTPLDVSYLSALYTPFSFILFYEVLLLILSIPQSTTGSIGRQYEIVSLIVIRNVFKDIGDFDSFSIVDEELGEFVDVLIDMGGGLLMFLMVAVFYHIRRRQLRCLHDDDEPDSGELKTFIARKKAVALLLSGLLFVLATYHFLRWSLEAYRVAMHAAAPQIDVKTIFYVDLFSVMIFTDVLILLFSMARAHDYHLVFRNAGFVISTILIRFSLTIEKPYDVELALLAMVFGTLVLWVYGYFSRNALPVRRSDGELSSDGEASG